MPCVCVSVGGTCCRLITGHHQPQLTLTSRGHIHRQFYFTTRGSLLNGTENFWAKSFFLLRPIHKAAGSDFYWGMEGTIKSGAIKKETFLLSCSNCPVLPQCNKYTLHCSPPHTQRPGRSFTVHLNGNRFINKRLFDLVSWIAPCRTLTDCLNARYLFLCSK